MATLLKKPKLYMVPPPGGSTGREEGKRCLERFRHAKQLKEPWLSVFEECYEYAMPAKESMFIQAPAQRRTDKIFDETAVVGVQEFASRLQAGLIPTFTRWADLNAGSEIPEEERKEVDEKLDAVTAYVFEILQTSNFNQEVAESLLDLAVGTGCLQVDESGDPLQPIRFSAIPLPHLYIDCGPDDSIDFIARNRKFRVGMLKQRYGKDAKLPSDWASLAQDKPDSMVEIIEAVYRDWEKPQETWCFYVFTETAIDEPILKVEYTGLGSCPIIPFRWTKMAGEAWGRGPLLNALPAIKTCNLTVQMILENAEMSIAGMYTVEDDGVINVDTIEIVPGTVIPLAPGSTMKAMGPVGNFDVAQLVLNDMRANIKRALFNDMLGNPDKTPMSATEVSTRMADLSRQIGSSFGRLHQELVQPLLRRVIHILKKQNRITLPQVNGREVKIVSTSPLAQAQSHQDVVTVTGYVQSLGQMFGPQLVNVIVKTEEAAKYIANKLQVPERLLRSDEEREQMMQMVAQAAQSQMAQPEEQGAAPPPEIPA